MYSAALAGVHSAGPGIAGTTLSLACPLSCTAAAGRRLGQQHSSTAAAAIHAAKLGLVAAAPDEALLLPGADAPPAARVGVQRVRRAPRQPEPEEARGSLRAFGLQQQQQRDTGVAAAYAQASPRAGHSYDRRQQQDNRPQGYQQDYRPQQQDSRDHRYKQQQGQQGQQRRWQDREDTYEQQQGYEYGSSRPAGNNWQPRQQQQQQRWQQSQQQPYARRGQQQQQLEREQHFSSAAQQLPESPSEPQQQQQQHWRYTHGLRQPWDLPTGLAVTWLGSSSGSPTRDRNVSCTALRLPGATYLVDVGEGSSRQIKATGVGVEEIDTLFITHLHGDHCFGIGTMLVAMCKARREAAAAAAVDGDSSSSDSSSTAAAADIGPDSPAALRVVGPPRVAELVAAMLFGAGVGRQLDLPLYITEFVESAGDAHDWEPLLPPPTAAAAGSSSCTAFVRRMAPTEELHWQKWPPELLSRLDATGVGWQPEVNGRRRYPTNFFAKPGLIWRLPCRKAVVTAAQLQHRVPCWGYVFDEILQPGSSTPADGSSCGSSADLGSDSSSSSSSHKLGRRVLLLGDTVDSRGIAPVAVGADLIAHEATFAAGMEGKAVLAQHSTAWMAGQFAWAIQAKGLVLTHFSARYEGSAAGGGMQIQAPPQHSRYGGRGEHRRDGGRDGRRVRSHELSAANDSDERATAALQREAEEQYGLGPVLLATDLLTCHVPRAEDDGEEDEEA